MFKADFGPLNKAVELNVLRIHKVGLCEFFCILFMLYETISILKNIVICELPVPKRLQSKIQKFLDEMTNEKVR